MAKGDDSRARNQINYQGNFAQNNLNNLRNTVVPQAQNSQNQLSLATDRQMGDYGDIMNQYKGFQAQNLAPVTAERMNYNRSNELNSALGGYQNFANSGGFSPEDVTAMRARGISPIRSVYQNSVNELGRQRALQGGYSPNYTAALAKMSGQLGQGIADQTQNVNAQIAQMVQQGKQFGLSGLGNLSLADQQMGQDTQKTNAGNALQASMFNRQTTDPLRLQAIQGQAQLYGTTPGLVNTFGNQMNQNMGNWLQTQGLQNQLGLGIMGAQTDAARIPGQWENNVNRIKDVSNIAGSFMGGM